MMEKDGEDEEDEEYGEDEESEDEEYGEDEEYVGITLDLLE